MKLTPAQRKALTGSSLGSRDATGTAVRRCPMRVGGRYALRAAPPYDAYREVAEELPSRARAVLAPDPRSPE